MADVLGIHFILKYDGVERILDSADVEFPMEDDERKPANRSAPVTHYTGKRCKIGTKGGLDTTSILPRGGSAVDVEVAVPDGFDATTLPLDWQDLIAGAYTGWVAGEPKISVKQGVVEFDQDIMSDCVELPESAQPVAP